MSLLELVSVLLDYPRDELWAQREALLDAAEREAPSAERRAELRDLVVDLLGTNPGDAQDSWLLSFERGRSMSLLLFEHLYGESRSRGQAMIDLEDTYHRHGFELSESELPDYLPLVLRYLAQRPEDEARDWLEQVRHVIAMLGARAGEVGSPYLVLFEILLDACDGKLDIAPVPPPVERVRAPVMQT